MTLTIGHATNLRVESWTRNGDEGEIVGTITADSADELTARRVQLMGLLNNRDENAYPLTWTVDSTMNGYYYVRDVSLNRLGVEDGTTATFALSVTRIGGGYSRPLFETVQVSTLRTNSHGVTSGPAVQHASYAPTIDDYYDIWSWDRGTGSTIDLTTEDGVVKVSAPTSTSNKTAGSIFAYLATTDYYKGTARLQLRFGGVWYNVHGRQIPLLSGADWRITNGYVRVYPSATGGAGRITVETYRSGNWVGREFLLGNANLASSVVTARTVTGDTTGYKTPAVIVNSPKQVTVRFTWRSNVFDISLRMGDTWIEVVGSNENTAYWGVAPSTTTASTSFTGGLHATSNDANGLRFLLACAAATNKNTATGELAASSGTALRSQAFQITPDYQVGLYTTPTDVFSLFLWARADQQRVVPR